MVYAILDDEIQLPDDRTVFLHLSVMSRTHTGHTAKGDNKIDVDGNLTEGQTVVLSAVSLPLTAELQVDVTN